MKLLLLTIFIFLSTTINAQEVRIFTTGQYKVMNVGAISGDVESFARKQALVSAKQKAIEQAGTTIYSSMYIKTSQKEQTAISKIEAISAGIIRVDILEESFKDNLYTVKIEASIEVASVEAVFNKADKRLKKITKLQKENTDISNKLTALAKEMAKILQHSSLYHIDEPKKIFEQQKRLLEDYERNINKIKVRFKEGTLAQMATNNMIRDENRLEILKKKWDEDFTKPYIENTLISIHNVNPTRSGRFVDIEFILAVRQENPMQNIGVAELAQRNRIHNKRLKHTMETIYLKHTKDSKLLLDWIDRYRNMAIVVTISDKKYMTERIVKSEFEEDYKTSSSSMGMISKIDRKIMGNTYDRRVEFLNTRLYLSHRKIFSLPIEDLESVDSITAELVMVDADFIECSRRDGGKCIFTSSRYNGGYEYLDDKGEAHRYYNALWKKMNK